ncbi:MAG: hypothetical protein ACI9Y1_002912 [Lentisphaeria bacterium]|jgi:hypothetical protein
MPRGRYIAYAISQFFLPRHITKKIDYLSVFFQSRAFAYPITALDSVEYALIFSLNHLPQYSTE